MYALGIDLGTTYTAAAVWRGGRATICPLGTRSAAVPSVVVVRANGTVLTGESAERRAVVEPDRVAREFKRRIGDPIPVLLGGVPHTAEELTAHLLSAVVDAVVAREGGRPSSIVVSHPANWGGFKIDLLRRAVESADLGVPVTYTTEPEAAAISYARQERLLPGETVAVYDLGGGTFDAAVLRRTPTGFTILGQPEGIEHLGGIDIDAAVFGHVARVIGRPLAELDEDDPSAVAAVGRLRTECTEAKEALSTDADTTVPILLPGFAGEVRLTRAELEAMVRPSLYDSIQSVQRALRSAGVTPEELSAVLLVGGSSRMPLVAQLVGAELGRPVAVDIHPKHAVALGAAWLASGNALPVAPAAAPVADSSVRPVVTAPATGVLPQVPITPAPLAETPTPPPAAAWFAPTPIPTPPVSPGPSVGAPGWGRDGVQLLRPQGAPEGRQPGPATPPPDDEDEDGRRRRAVLFGGMMGAEAGAAGIAGFEAGRATASEAVRGGHSLAGPQVPDPGSAGGLVQGPSGHLSAHGITPTHAPQPLYSPPPSPDQMLSAPPSTPPSTPHAAPMHAPSAQAPSAYTPSASGHPGTVHEPLANHAHTAAAKTAAAGRAAYRTLQVRNPVVAGAAAGLVAVLVVIAGYFALTDDRTATLVASTEPGTSAPADPSPTPTVSVTPTPGRLVVGVSLSGSGGSVTSSDGRISCPGTCTASYPAGQSVTLVARGAGFLGWSGCGQQDGATCRISGDGAAMPVARFRVPAVAGSTSSRADLAPTRSSTTADPSTTTPTTAPTTTPPTTTPSSTTTPTTSSTSTSATTSTSTSSSTTAPEITSDPPTQPSSGPFDPCRSDPTAPGCTKPDPCVANPNAAGCTKPDPCVANPNAAGCTKPDPCVANPKAAGCTKPDPSPSPAETLNCQKTRTDPRCTVKDPPTLEPAPKDPAPRVDTTIGPTRTLEPAAPAPNAPAQGTLR